MVTLGHVIAIIGDFAFLLFLTFVKLHLNNTEQTEEHVMVIVTRNHQGKVGGMLPTITTNGGHLLNTDYAQSYMLVSSGFGDCPLCSNIGTLSSCSRMRLDPSASFCHLSGGVGPNVGTRGQMFTKHSKYKYKAVITPVSWPTKGAMCNFSFYN